MPLSVVVASRNRAKTGAVRAVFGRIWPDLRLSELGVEMPAEISEMPTGDQIRAGAIFRARRALEQVADADFAVGCEGGVEFAGADAYLYNWVAIGRRDGRLQTAPSAKLLLPPAVGAAIRQGRLLGDIMIERTGQPDINETDGAVGYFTRGLLSRRALFEEALACALAPFLSPREYGVDELAVDLAVTTNIERSGSAGNPSFLEQGGDLGIAGAVEAIDNLGDLAGLPDLPKADVRRTARRLRANVADRAEKQRRIVATLAHTGRWPRPACVMLYAAFGDEIDVTSWAEQLIAQGVAVTFPVIGKGAKSLTPTTVNAITDLQPGSFGIREPRPGLPARTPAALDLVVVPGLTFDRAGFRVGYGGGYYDRFLPRLRPDAVTVGVTFSELFVERLPRAPHDIPVQWVVTDREAFRTTPR